MRYDDIKRTEKNGEKINRWVFKPVFSQLLNTDKVGPLFIGGDSFPRGTSVCLPKTGYGDGIKIAPEWHNRTTII